MKCSDDDAARYFRWLDSVRGSGRINMFGIRAELAKQFGLGRDLSAAVLAAWMRTYDGKLSPAHRVAQARTK